MRRAISCVFPFILQGNVHSEILLDSSRLNNSIMFSFVKKVREKSRECHNHKPQPFPDTKRKRQQTKTSANRTNVRKALTLALS